MDIIQEARKFALKEIEKFGLPTMISFEISEKKALELTGKLKTDKIITLVGVYLMDIKLGEASSQGKAQEHIKMGIKASEEFLERFDLNERTKKKIINCIETHHEQAPFICKEAEICANADCYRFLHPKGFFAFFGDYQIIGKKMSLSFQEFLEFAEVKIDEKYEILSLDICKQELEKYYPIFKELIKSAKKL